MKLHFLLSAVAGIFSLPASAQVANQCVPAGSACPAGSSWSCCTWACDEKGEFCRDCLLQDQKCLTDSQCCIGVCDTQSGTCASCVPEGRACNQVDYAPDGCCSGDSNDLKCSEKTKTCIRAKPIDAECSADDECLYSCCEKGLGKKTGKCTDGDMCHMGRIIIWIIAVQLIKYGAIIGAIAYVIYWIWKHCFDKDDDDKKDEQDAVNRAQRIRVHPANQASTVSINSGEDQNLINKMH